MEKIIDNSKLGKSTIFGNECFFDPKMIILEYNRQLNDCINDCIIETLENNIKSIKYSYKIPNVIIDKERLKKWLDLCLKLENIDKSDLVDMATQKKFLEIQRENKVYKRAFELCCGQLINIFCDFDKSCENCEVINKYKNKYKYKGNCVEEVMKHFKCVAEKEIKGE